MEEKMYSINFLESLSKESLLILMDEHDYEEGYEEFTKNELVDQLSCIPLL